MTVEREALADSLLEFVLDDVYYVQKARPVLYSRN